VQKLAQAALENNFDEVSFDVTLGSCFSQYTVRGVFKMAVRATDPGSQAVSKTHREGQFLEACLETARDWSHSLKLLHWIRRCGVFLFAGIAFAVAARSATLPKQFRVLEDNDASGGVRHVSPVSAAVANRQRQKHELVGVSKSETSVAEPSKRHGHLSKEKLAKAGERKLSPKRSSTARSGVSHDQIRK
jgi:hypothetical protein